MDITNNDTVNINKYYSLVDKNVINHLCTDNNIKNLIHLSIKTELNPFNKCKKKWNLKSKRTLLKECENIKKKEVTEISSCLNNLSKLGNNNLNDLKNIYKKSENKMDNLHKLINCINNIDLLSQESSINIIENILEDKEIINEPVVVFSEQNQPNLLACYQENSDKPLLLNSENTVKLKTTYIIDHDNKSKSNIVSFDIIEVNKKDTNNKPNKKDTNDKPNKKDTNDKPNKKDTNDKLNKKDTNDKLNKKDTNDKLNKKDDKIIKLTIINNLQSENSDSYLECFGNY